MAAEALGVFFYVYPGIASQASFFLNGAEPAFGSLFQIGLAYAIGTRILDLILFFLNVLRRMGIESFPLRGFVYVEMLMKYRNCFCNHCLRSHFWWSLQPCNHFVLRGLARVG